MLLSEFQIRIHMFLPDMDPDIQAKKSTQNDLKFFLAPYDPFIQKKPLRQKSMCPTETWKKGFIF